jgi:hypothetical protein
LYLRIPKWCAAPGVDVNGAREPVEAIPLSYLALDREWKDGDTITLRLPMKISVRRWEKNKNSASVARGPIWFSLKIGERYARYGGSDAWPESEVYPTTPWNYGLVLNEQSPASSFEVIQSKDVLAENPFTQETAALRLKAKARRIAQWTTDENNLLHTLEPSPVKSDEPLEVIELIPMGAARLRISSFPVIGG